jgi:hypothetical protein
MKAIELNDEYKKQYIASLKEQLRNITNVSLPNSENLLFEYVPEVFLDIYNLSI